MSGAWAIARQIEDLKESPPNDIVSVFSQDGVTRAADRLNQVSADVLAAASADPTKLATALLGGPDQVKYCEQLKSLNEAGGSLDVPVDLLYTRVVVAAIAPYLPSIADAVRRTNDPGEALRQVSDTLRKVVSDERLAMQLDLLASVASEVGLTRPAGWVGDWPPTAEKLTEWADALRHAAAETLPICSQAAAPLPTLTTVDAARELALPIVDAAQIWASGCGLAQLKDAENILPEIPDPPQVFDIVREVVAPEAPSLAFLADPEHSEEYLLEMKLGGTALPLGLTFRHVTVDPDTGQLKFVSAAVLPNLADVEVAALDAALERLGVPRGLEVSDAKVVAIDETFSQLTLSVKFDFGPYVGIEVPLVLIKDGRSQDLDTQVKSLVADVGKAIEKQIRSQLPAIRLGGRQLALTIGIDNPDDPALALNLDAGTARIRGTLDLPVSLGEADTVHLGVLLSLSLHGDADIKLLDATWPADIVETTKATLLKLLPTTEVGASSCVGLTGLSATLNDDNELTLLAVLTEGGVAEKSFALDFNDPIGTLGPQLLALLTEQPVIECIAREVLAMTSAEAAAALDDLRNRRVTILGEEFALTDVDVLNTSGKLQFTANLVSTSEADLRISGITIDGSWLAGSPLPASAIGFTGATLPGSLVERLLTRIDNRLASWIDVDRISIASGRIALTGTLTIPGLSSTIQLDQMTLDLAGAKDVVIAALQSAAIEAIDEQAKEFEDDLASMGRLKSIALDKDNTKLVGDFDIVFRVEAEPMSGVVLPFLVHLPTFKVEAQTDFKTLAIGAIGNAVTEAMGSLEIGSAGLKPKGPFIDNQRHRYGISFDASVKLAGLIEVELKDMVLDQHGLTMPDSFTVKIGSYILIFPPYVAISDLGGTVWVHPAGKFAVSAGVVLSFDPTGVIIKIAAVLTGNGPAKTIEADGKILLFTIPLFEAKGVVDFASEVITMEAKTLEPLASVLNMKTDAVVDAKAKTIAATSDMSLLGLKTTGKLDVHLTKDKLVRLTGAAEWKSLGSASLALETTTELKKPMASGHVGIDFIGASADFDIDLAHVRLAFKWKGIGLSVIAPNVGRVDRKLIEDLIESLFDFKFSFDDLKNIEINLLDKNGNKTGSYGEGGAQGDKPDDGGGQPPPPDGGGTGPSDGNSTVKEDVSDKCSQYKPDPGGRMIWAENAQLQGDSYEGELRDNAIWINERTRIASPSVLQLLSGSTVLTCLQRTNSPYKPFHYIMNNNPATSVDMLSPIVAVVVPNAALGIQALEFAKGSIPTPITMPEGAEQVIFGADGLAGAAAWQPTPRGLALLRKIVMAQLELAIVVDRVHAVPAETIIPEWPGKPVNLIEEHRGPDHMIVLADDNENEATIEQASPLFEVLTANPTGLIARLAGSVRPLSSLDNSTPPISLRSTSGGQCELVLADAGFGAQYLIAHQGDSQRLGRLADMTTWSGTEGGWLDTICPFVAQLPATADILLAAGRSLDGTSRRIAIRTEPQEGVPAYWILSAVNDPETEGGAPPPKSLACVTEEELKEKLERAPAVIDGSILDWSSQTNIDRMLSALTGDTDDWEQAFLADPRGIFLAVAAQRDGAIPCPTLPQ